VYVQNGAVSSTPADDALVGIAVSLASTSRGPV